MVVLPLLAWPFLGVVDLCFGSPLESLFVAFRLKRPPFGRCGVVIGVVPFVLAFDEFNGAAAVVVEPFTLDGLFK